MKEWGYSQPNCEFIQTDVEKLMDLQLEPFDVIVSNGLLCLIPNKTNIFNILSNLLKEGGEFYDSDIFSDVEQCLEVKNNPIYNCYGISDAMIWSDLQRVAGRVGFSDPYLIYAAEAFQFEHEKLKQDLRGVNYACAVYRLIKLAPEQSEGGAVVTYKGTLDNCDESFKWDVDLTFKRGVPVKIDGCLASLLSKTKYSNHFVIEESTDKVTTEKNQNPFVYLKKLREDDDNNRFFEDIIDKSL
ncbi:arsenite methyltransferase-like isoform X2 [Physella acuta]|uniref:arsenite methyltransferase-like isoform X2 n=1 Tax=Physella acuta TaxID=109671 RepID=UPI0027DD4A4F|nr:arsenite methyltransferase-like isoform X2 [Physella acuta]